MFLLKKFSATSISRLQRILMTSGALLLTVMIAVDHNTKLNIAFALSLFFVNSRLIKAQEKITAEALAARELHIRVLKAATASVETRVSDLERLARLSRNLPLAEAGVDPAELSSAAEIYKC